MSNIKIKLHSYFCVLACFFMLLAALPGLAAEHDKDKPVRVGWYVDVYNITGEDGERSGYVYEFEQAIAAYTGWKYEYVAGRWPDLMRMVENGEIDLMASVSYTDERSNKMLFSDAPMGKEIYYLYADLKHTNISATDLATLNGKRVGVLSGSVQEQALLDWEKKHNLSLRHVTVKNFEDAKTKIESREIDSISSIETPDWVNVGVMPVAVTGTSGVYFAVNKNRPDIKAELDNAMRKLDYDRPFFADELYKRYLSTISNAALSGEEESWPSEHGTIRIGYLNHDGGVSSLENGKLVGVINDYIKFATDCLGEKKLKFEVLGFNSQEEQLQALQDGKIDVMFHGSQNPYAGEKNGFILSNSILTANMAAVTDKAYFDENAANSVAVEKGNLLLRWYVSYNYPKWKVVECASLADVEAAVKSGKADCYVIESGRLTRDMDGGRLHSVFLSKPGRIAFAVSHHDTVLLSILNKTIKTMPTSMLTSALAMYNNTLKKVTVMDFIKDNLLVAIVIVVVMFLVILSLLRKSQQAEARAVELNKKLQASQHELQEALLRAQSANAAKTTFLSNVSHDIRTPMNAIVGLTELMENDIHKPHKLSDYLGKLKASSHHLLNLINDILDMNKIESGKVTLNEVPFSLDDQLAQLDSVIRSQAKARQQTFEVQKHNIKHEYIKGDATRLQQVLQNLLSNAVKYTDLGGTVLLEIEEMPRNGHYARFKFTVTDNGMGISKEFQKHIYEAFTRAENSMTNSVQGTGLGMAITKSIVDMMGGSISLTSELGKGSSFEVLLEFKVNEEAEAAAQEQKQAENFTLKGLRFLCAEDNKLNAEILEAILGMKGASCVICHDGEDIVERFKAVQPGEFDAILMDVQMPKMNGYEATMVIRSGENPLGRTIPIIAMTANAFAEDVQKSFDAGMDAHLSKPVDITVLEQTMRRFHSGFEQADNECPKE